MTDEKSELPPKKPKARILVLDDDPDIRELLGMELSAHGYEVIPAGSGDEAMAVIRTGALDLAMVDVVLPDVNGYEIVAKIKENTDTRWVPVIMLTGLRTTKDKIKGLDNGADDFISKPFDKVELLARVRSLLRAAGLHRMLEQSVREIAQLQRVKDHLYRLVIHDLRGPVTSILGALDLMESEVREGNREKTEWLLKKAGRACENILEMVRTLVDIEKMERGELVFEKSPVPAQPFMRNIFDQWTPLAAIKKIGLAFEGAPELTLTVDAAYLKRAIGNLLSNAIRYSPEASSIRMGARDLGEAIEFFVYDEGPGMAPEKMARLFDPAFQAANRAARAHEGGFGLGLTLVRLVAEGHGGKAWAEPNSPSGCKFTVRIQKKGS